MADPVNPTVAATTVPDMSSVATSEEGWFAGRCLFCVNEALDAQRNVYIFVRILSRIRGDALRFLDKYPQATEEIKWIANLCVKTSTEMLIARYPRQKLDENAEGWERTSLNVLKFWLQRVIIDHARKTASAEPPVPSSDPLISLPES